MTSKDLADTLAGGVLCRGPRVFTDEQVTAIIKHRDGLLDKYDLENAVAYFTQLNAALNRVGCGVDPLPADEKPTLELARRHLVLATNARKACGFDYAPAIVKAGFDGEQHEIPCGRKCGTTYVYTAALSDEASAEKAERDTKALADAVTPQS